MVKNRDAYVNNMYGILDIRRIVYIYGIIAMYEMSGIRFLSLYKMTLGTYGPARYGFTGLQVSYLHLYLSEELRT